MPDEDARLEAVLDKHHDRFARSIDRCRAILSDCRTKLGAKVHGAGADDADEMVEEADRARR